MPTSSPEAPSIPCAVYGSCGGCSLQHLPQADYTEHKQRILEEAFARNGLDSGSLRPLFRLPIAARRRADWKVNRSSDTIELGYYARESHRLVDIAACPILHPELNALIPPLKAALKTLPASVSVQAVHATLVEQGIDLTLTLATAPDLSFREALAKFANALNLARLNLCISDRTEPIYSPSPPTIRLGNHSVPLPPSIFLQATEEAQAAISGIIQTHLKKAKRVLDLFSGIGTYSFVMAETAQVLAVEGDSAMVEALQSASRKAGIGERLKAECRDLFRNPFTVSELNGFDGVIVNPPRAGAKAQCELLARSNVPRIVMVSCDPMTGARDLAILRQGGYRILEAVGIDQFAYSPHLEMAAILSKDKKR